MRTDGLVIAVINKKGGVGKTPISFSLAKDLGLKYQSNDKSIVPELLGEDRAKITQKVSFEPNTIYDFGGFADAGVLDIVKKADVVIVPCRATDVNSFLQTEQTLNEIMPYNSTIVVIITQTEKESDFQDAINILSEWFDGLNFYEIRKSAIFKNALDNALSVSEVYNGNPLSRSVYKTVFNQYKTVLDLFTGE